MNAKKSLTVFALICVPALFLALAPAHAEAELEARFWMPEIDGLLQVTEGSIGTELDLTDDIGIVDENATEVRLTWRMPGPLVVRFGYVPLGYTGEASLNETIEFAGVTFPIAFNLSSQLDLDYVRAGVGWLFRVNEDVRVGPMVELKALRAEAALQGSILGIPLVAATDTEEVAFGSIGGAFDAKPLPMLHIVGEAGYSPGLDYGELIEAELGLKYSPVKIVSIFGGYRLITLDVEDDDDRFDFDMSGPYAGVSVAF